MPLPPATGDLADEEGPGCGVVFPLTSGCWITRGEADTLLGDLELSFEDPWPARGVALPGEKFGWGEEGEWDAESGRGGVVGDGLTEAGLKGERKTLKKSSRLLITRLISKRISK